MKEIKDDIRKGEYRRAYLLFGEESYLVSRQEKDLRENILGQREDVMNSVLLEGKAAGFEAIYDGAETLPFLNPYRLVVVKESGLFASGRKEDSEKLADYILHIPPTTVLVFVEKEVDKRSRLYKRVNETGRAAEYKALTEKELMSFAARLFKERNCPIASSVAAYLVHNSDGSLDWLINEAAKLADYKNGEGEVVKEDVDKLCAKSLATRIFDLTDAIGRKDAPTALEVYSHMILMKESPLMVLTMIARQFKNLLQCGYLRAAGADINEIGERLGLRGFIVRELLEQSHNFTQAGLIKALDDCLMTDVGIKSGKIEESLGVETLIVQYCLS